MLYDCLYTWPPGLRNRRPGTLALCVAVQYSGRPTCASASSRHADVVLELCSRVLASMSYESTVERRCRPLVREASARHVPPRGLVVLIKYCKPTRRLFVRRRNPEVLCMGSWCRVASARHVSCNREFKEHRTFYPLVGRGRSPRAGSAHRSGALPFLIDRRVDRLRARDLCSFVPGQSCEQDRRPIVGYVFADDGAAESEV